MLQRIPALPDSRTHDPYHTADDLGYSVIKKKKKKTDRFNFANNYKLTTSSKHGERNQSQLNFIYS